MTSNQHGEPILTGNERASAFADLLGDLLSRALSDEFCGEGHPSIDVSVVHGFQPFIEVTLSNGAAWQLTPVRSSWPTDGTSAQWDDEDDAA